VSFAAQSQVVAVVARVVLILQFVVKKKPAVAAVELLVGEWTVRLAVYPKAIG
jgi:hypothetical protein